MAKFDANAFLSQTVSKKLDTKRIPCPEDNYDVAQIVKLELNSGSVKEGENAGKPWARLRARIEILDADAKAECKLTGDANPAVYWEEFLSLTEDGQLDVSDGQNIQLGKLRAACGQNNDEEWSIMDLEKATLGAKVKHRLKADGDAYAVCAGVYNPEAVEDEDEL